MFASLALDPTTGYPRISYYDMTNNKLKYAEYDEILGVPVWSIKSLTAGGNTNAIALDNSNLPHIIYSDRNRHVRHTWKACSICTWQSEDVDLLVETAGTNIALAIDASDNLHIAYYDSLSTSLYYRKKAGNTWSGTTNLGYGMEPSMTLDSSGRPAMVYKTDSTINYLSNNGSVWNLFIIYNDSSTTGQPGGPSLQLQDESSDSPRISFIDDSGYVRLAFSDEMDPSCPGTNGNFACDPPIDATSTFRSFTSLAWKV